jgi:hypothetical protein
MNNNVLPKIEHADVTLNERNRVVIQMDEGWVFYRLDVFPDGAPTDKKAYSSYGVLSLDYDYSNFIVIAESEIPEEPEIPETPEEPETETQATETDYINALKELGVTFDE